MQQTNWEQYQDFRHDEGRGHHLVDINKNIHPFLLEEMIQERINLNRQLREKTRVMEVGGGNGLAIMELKKKFPEVEFYIINRRKTHGIYRREGLGGAALAAKLFTHEELEDIELPYLIFKDLDYGSSIPYNDEKFDVIYSYNLLPRLKYKFEFISETLRILKEGGSSLHVGLGDIHFYHNSIKIESREAYHQLKRLGFDIHHTDHFILLKKNSPQALPLRPHFPIPNRPEESDLKKMDMGYHLPD